MAVDKNFTLKLITIYDQLLKEYKQVEGSARIIMENSFDADYDLVAIQTQFNAAKRGLGIVNKLPYGEDKVKHAKRVMTNLNRIRGLLRQLENEMARSFKIQTMRDQHGQ
jgi:hypothetical protein